MGDGPLDIEQIPGFEDLWNEALEEIHQKISKGDDGPHKIAIQVTVQRKGVIDGGKDYITASATLQVKGPSPSKLCTRQIELYRENSTLVPAPQRQKNLGLGE